MAGYIRQSTFVDGDTITAALFNNEYNQLVNAFSNTSGHKHDGTTAEGPVIGLIGDAGETSPNNKVLIDTTNNYIEFYVEVSSAPVQQLYIADGAIIPVTDNDIDLGTSSLEFKDIYIDGTATIDTLTVDEAATIGTTLGVTGATTLSSTLAVTGTSTLTGNVTATNDLSVGGNLTVTGNATISGNLTFGDADTDSINLAAEIDSDIIPNTDGTYDLGSATKEWQDLYIDGTANIDSLVADTADINGGTIDGATIATSDITVGAGKTLNVSAGTLTLADNQISGDKVEGGTIAATTITDLTFGSLNDGTITVTAFVDEDNMVSDSATLVPTQQSVKAYVDSQVTAQDLDFQGDTGGALSIDLDSESLTIAGGTGLDTVGSGNTVTVNIDSTVATLTGSQTLTNKTIDVDNNTVSNIEVDNLKSGVLDTDLSTVAATDTTLASAKAIKTYVDAQVTAQDLDFAGDTGGALSIDLDSESLTIAGGTGIDTVGASNTLTVNIDSTVATLTGSQTLTNKTLTSPVLNTGVSGTAVLDDDTFATATSTTLASSESIKAYVDAQILTEDTLAELNDTNITSPADGALLFYDTGTSMWIDNVVSGDITIADTGVAAISSGVIVNDDINASAAISISKTALVDGTGLTLTGDTLSVDAAQTQITSVGTLGSLTVSGDLTVDTSTLKVDSTNNRVGIGNATPDVSLDVGSNTDAIHVPSGTTAERPVSPAAGYFRYNSTTGDFEGYTDAWGAIAGGGGGTAPAIDTMTGDGSDTTLTLTSAPVNENATVVTIDGVVQHKDTYSVSSNTLTFSEAPPTGTAVECITWTNTAVNSALLMQDADGDTQIQVEESSDEDKIRFDTGGTERMIIDSTGVGIGTSSPSTALHIQGSDYTTMSIQAGTTSHGAILNLGDSGDINYGSITQFASAAGEGGRMRFIAGTTETMNLRGGSVGIGTASPDFDLDILDTSTASNTGAGVNISHATQPQLRFAQTTGNYRMYLGIRTNDLIIANDSGAEKVRFEQNGSVGIGTTSPQTSTTGLHVVHDATEGTPSFPAGEVIIAQRNFNSSQGADIAIISGTQSGSSINFGDKDNSQAGRIQYDNNNNAFRFFTNGSNERMRIDSSGIVLVGTTSRTVGIIGDVNGFGVSADGGPNNPVVAFADSDATVNANSVIQEISFKNDTSFTAYYTKFTDRDATEGSISGSGTGSVSFNTTSDERLKENIVNTTNKLDKIKQIQVKDFNYIGKDVTTTGLIAQELNTIIPDVVREGSEDAAKDPWGVDYGKLTPYLIKAIQEQQTQIDALQSEINLLKGE